jgi:hypothetical protein
MDFSPPTLFLLQLLAASAERLEVLHWRAPLVDSGEPTTIVAHSHKDDAWLDQFIFFGTNVNSGSVGPGKRLASHVVRRC